MLNVVVRKPSNVCTQRRKTRLVLYSAAIFAVQVTLRYQLVRSLSAVFLLVELCNRRTIHEQVAYPPDKEARRIPNPLKEPSLDSSEKVDRVMVAHDCSSLSLYSK
jgi:hypothetical protein